MICKFLVGILLSHHLLLHWDLQVCNRNLAFQLMLVAAPGPARRNWKPAGQSAQPSRLARDVKKKIAGCCRHLGAHLEILLFVPAASTPRHPPGPRPRGGRRIGRHAGTHLAGVHRRRAAPAAEADLPARAASARRWGVGGAAEGAGDRKPGSGGPRAGAPAVPPTHAGPQCVRVCVRAPCRHSSAYRRREPLAGTAADRRPSARLGHDSDAIRTRLGRDSAISPSPLPWSPSSQREDSGFWRPAP